MGGYTGSTPVSATNSSKASTSKTGTALKGNQAVVISEAYLGHRSGCHRWFYGFGLLATHESFLRGRTDPVARNMMGGQPLIALSFASSFPFPG